MRARHPQLAIERLVNRYTRGLEKCRYYSNCSGTAQPENTAISPQPDQLGILSTSSQGRGLASPRRNWSQRLPLLPAGRESIRNASQ